MKPQEKFPARCWVHWTENPRQGAAKLYASPTPPDKSTNPYWKPDEYLSLQEHESALTTARAEAFEAAEDFFREQMTMCSETGQDPEGSRQSMESCKAMAKAERAKAKGEG